MIEKPKKERRFLKTLGKIGEILLQEVLLKVGSNLVKRIGGKKTLPSILFLLLSISLFAQYPATGNKQRLGYQTTGDGLVYRGRALDTMTIKSSGLNNAYFILDTVNNILYNYIKTKGGWKFSNGDTVIINNTVDTTSLSNRINLKVNIADTASMLLPYLRKADTASMLTPYFKKSDTTSLNLNSRFAAKLNISDTSSMLTNYLRTGVAAGTYLPLTGGTISGTINRQEGSNDGSAFTFYYNILNYFAKRDNNKANQTAQITFTDRPGTFTFPNNVRTSDIYLMTAKNFSGGQLGQYLDTTISVVANQDGGRLGISNLNPLYKLDVNGTLGVTGAATLSNLAGSGTRMVTASSTGLLSTQNILTNPITGTGTTNYLPKFTETSTLGNSIIYDSGTNIGIGLTTANSKLTLYEGDFKLFKNHIFEDTATWYANILFTDEVDRLGAKIVGERTSWSSREMGLGFETGTINSVTRRMTITSNGNIGIGTKTPNAIFDVRGSVIINEDSGDFDTRIESDGNANMVFVDASTDRVGIGTASPSTTLEVNGTLGVTGIANFTNQMTISGSVSGSNRLLGKNTSNNGVGDITIGTGLSLTSNNLTASGTDTTSLSDRINLKYNSSGGTISGAVTLSTTTATPTSLLGKDGSNVVGQVTTLTQTGLMKASGVTQNTSSVGIITVAHGLSYTPSQVFVTVAQQSSYVAVCHAITSTNISFTFYNSTTGIALDNVSVGFFWLAIK